MDTTVLQNYPSNILTDTYKVDVAKLSQAQCISLKLSDIVDNPKKPENFPTHELSQDEIFETMKHELNRLNSYNNKWPLDFIKPEDLAEAGFFYLQTEDRVQCPFCCVIVFSWNLGDRPLREHMKKSPRCPFLLSCDVGNIPLYRETRCIKSPINNHHKEHCATPKLLSTSYKPKHPRMADIRRRLMTYEGWPVKTLSVQQLAECGLYYTGVSDVVTCFFCGGSLGNWEVNDNPWVEHAKYFSYCAYLSLAKNNAERSQNLLPPVSSNSKISAKDERSYEQTLANSLESEIVEEAFEIFPKSLVLEVLSDYKKKTGRTVTSLHQLCEEILEYKELQKKLALQLKESEKEVNYIEKALHPEISESVLPGKSAASNKRETFLCKICMDQEMGVVFQPCGHLVSCLNCSREISNCPLCRRPIINIVRTYLS